MLTPAGMETDPLLLLSETTVAPLAALFSDAVHVLDVLLASTDGEQNSDVNCAGATRFRMLPKDAPAALAVTIAV